MAGSAPLRVTDRLTLTDGTFDVTSGTLTLASAGNASTGFVSGSGSGTVNGDVTVEWRVPSGWDGWQALTAPVNAPFDGTASALLSNMWTQRSGSGTGYDAANGGVSNSSVFDYDETASVGGSTTEDLNDAWFAPSDISTAITQGQTGRLVFFFGDRDFDGNDESGSSFTLSATGALLDEENTNTDVDLGLSYTENDGGGDADGWNLVGTPFMAPLDWELMTDDGAGRSNVSRTVYIPKADGTYATYQADDAGTGGSSTNGGSRYLSPFQGFFVKATGSSPSLTVKSDDKALTESPTLKRNGETAPRVKLRMQAETSSRDEETVVHFSDGATMDASDGDAYQLTPFGSDYFYIASEIPDSSSAYEIQSRPLPDSTTRVPLTLASTSTRTYTLGGTLSDVPADWTVRLRDRRTGATADLARGESLTVELEGDNASSSKAGASAASGSSPDAPPSAPRPLVARTSDPAPVRKALNDSTRGSLEVIRPGPSLKLTQFDGHIQEDAVKLSWAASVSTSEARVSVQRSAPGATSWETRRVVQMSKKDSRRVTDELPFEGSTFRYRLKVEAGGSTTYSDPITVKRTAPSTLHIRSVYPNPAHSEITIKYTLPEDGPVTMALHDVLGRRVSTPLNESKKAGPHESSFSVTSLSSGVHFLRLRAGSTTRTEKIVVTR